MEDFAKRLLSFIVILLVQAAICSHIHLFGYATPLLPIYFVLQFPLVYPRWAVLLWSFAMGFVIDIFTNTPGVCASSLTIMGCVQPYLLATFYAKDANDLKKVSAKTLTVRNFLGYSVLMTLIFCLLFFTFEAFNLFNFEDWMFRVLASWLLTTILILVLENFRR